jgi:hypothetical protein
LFDPTELDAVVRRDRASDEPRLLKLGIDEAPCRARNLSCNVT